MYGRDGGTEEYDSYTRASAVLPNPPLVPFSRVTSGRGIGVSRVDRGTGADGGDARGRLAIQRFSEAPPFSQGKGGTFGMVSRLGVEASSPRPRRLAATFEAVISENVREDARLAAAVDADAAAGASRSSAVAWASPPGSPVPASGRVAFSAFQPLGGAAEGPEGERSPLRSGRRIRLKSGSPNDVNDVSMRSSDE